MPTIPWYTPWMVDVAGGARQWQCRLCYVYVGEVRFESYRHWQTHMVVAHGKVG